jgi:hypothetical protein
MRLRTVMASVAIVAVAFSIERTWGRWTYARKQADLYAKAEVRESQSARNCLEESRIESSGFWAVRLWESSVRGKETAAYYAALKRHYERAASRPWEPLSPEPPRPPGQPLPPEPDWLSPPPDKASEQIPPPPPEVTKPLPEDCRNPAKATPRTNSPPT